MSAFFLNFRGDVSDLRKRGDVRCVPPRPERAGGRMRGRWGATLGP